MLHIPWNVLKTGLTTAATRSAPGLSVYTESFLIPFRRPFWACTKHEVSSNHELTVLKCAGGQEPEIGSLLGDYAMIKHTAIPHQGS